MTIETPLPGNPLDDMVQAVRSLAFEQRTANHIAYLQLCHDTRSTKLAPEWREHDQQIRAALGLDPTREDPS